MALFGLLWLMRIRAEVRKDKRKRSKHRRLDEQILLPPPVSFADPKHSVVDDVIDDVIPPPPPPPLRQNVQIHRSSASIEDGLHYPTQRFFQQAQSFSRSAQNLRNLECTCPTGPPIRRPAVRFCDDPFGFYSARTAQSWNYSTLPRARPTSRSSHGLFFFCFSFAPGIQLMAYKEGF